MTHDFRVNERIKAPMVRLVLSDGANLGVLSREEALQRAAEGGLDLVEVAPETNPPVCKLLDYGKFKYRQKKRLRQAHHRALVKEIWIGPDTQQHDLQFKADRAREFLQDHHKVMIVMRLSGRQRAHSELAMQQLTLFGQRFADVGKVERAATREESGRLTMVLSPK